MRILLVEDEPSAAHFIAKGLREARHAVDVATDGRVAAEQCQQNDYDAVILDVMLPGKDGLTVCRELRAAGSDVPVLMLTARDAVEARVEGLDAGADDYLTKPFDFRELLARVRALTRRDRRPLVARAHRSPAPGDRRPGQRVWSHGREVALTSREYALLEYLARRAGEVVGRADIAEHVWDEHYDAFSNVVDVYVQRLRRKLDEADEPSLIRTRRGQGYQCWGFTACDGPGWIKRSVNGVDREFYGYIARGAPFGPDDGTVAPWVVVASLPFAPEIVIPTVRQFARLDLGMTAPYGFKPSFNQTFAVEESPTGWWVTPHHFGIDQGPVVLMIENYRSGLIWNIMRRCPAVIAGLRRAGFTGGWL